MTNDEARRVLKEINFPDDHVWNWRSFTKTDGMVTTFYGFTSDQLEAIAMWMRDPKAFTSAGSPQTPQR